MIFLVHFPLQQRNLKVFLGMLWLISVYHYNAIACSYCHEILISLIYEFCVEIILSLTHMCASSSS